MKPRKLAKINAEIEQLEKSIAEDQEKLSKLKKERTEAENSEIVSLVRNANMTIEEMAQLISMRNVKKAPANVDNGTAAETYSENNVTKGNVD